MFSWNGITSARFVALQNFETMFRDSTFFRALLNGLVYTAVGTTYQFFIGMVMAILLNSISFFRNTFKVLLFIPCVISTVAISQIFIQLLAFNPMGIVNILIRAVGLKPTAFLGNVNTSLISVVLVDGFKFCGIYMVMFSSAFASLSADVEEAALLDGCNWLQKYLLIKIPMIKDVCVVALVMLVNGTLKAFEIPFIMTNGGPGASSELISTFMYKMSFSALRFGYGSALAVFLLFECLLTVTIVRKILPQADY
jgi:raffinose/stachyose/melibiose transport system permease protein